MHIALATNRAYLPWCATAIRSCDRSTLDRPLVFHVFHLGDLTAVDQRAAASVVTEHATVRYHPVEPAALEGLPSKGEALGGYTSWIRVLLPDLLPDVDRATYLDADILAVDSLAGLADVDLDGAPLAAVANIVEPAMHAHVRALGIDDPTRYFNAGVLVMDLARMRAEATTEEVRRFVSVQRGGLPWFDQDALNVVCAGRWRALHPRWNVQNSLWAWGEWAIEVHGAARRDEALADPAIVHFEGPSICKPWHYLCQHEFRDRYRAELAATPWRDEPLVERTLATRVIHRLPADAQMRAYRTLVETRLRLRTAKGRARGWTETSSPS